MPQPVVRAGYLRHRITIQDKTVSQNSYGEEDITWSTIATVWGSIEPIRGREYLEARQEQADLSHRIRLRYGVTITPSMRLVSAGRVYEIEAVINPLERNRFIEIMAREAINA